MHFPSYIFITLFPDPIVPCARPLTPFTTSPYFSANILCPPSNFSLSHHTLPLYCLPVLAADCPDHNSHDVTLCTKPTTVFSFPCSADSISPLVLSLSEPREVSRCFIFPISINSLRSLAGVFRQSPCVPRVFRLARRSLILYLHLFAHPLLMGIYREGGRC